MTHTAHILPKAEPSASVLSPHMGRFVSSRWSLATLVREALWELTDETTELELEVRDSGGSTTCLARGTGELGPPSTSCEGTSDTSEN